MATARSAGAGTGTADLTWPLPARQLRTISVDPAGSTVRRTVLPNGLRDPDRGDRGDAQRLLRHLGGRRLPRRDAGTGRRLALPGTPAVQGHPCQIRAGHLRRRSRRSAGRPTRSPPRSTPATTRGCSTRTCRWPSTSCATWSPIRCSPTADVETERGVILEEIAMHDDEPGDEVHDLFIRGPLRTITRWVGRSPAPPRPSRRWPRTDLVASTTSATPRRRWWSPPPATWTTIRWSEQVAPAFDRVRAIRRCQECRRPATAQRCSGPVRPGQVVVAGRRTPSRPTSCWVASVRPRRRAAVRPGRTQQRARRGHV